MEFEKEKFEVEFAVAQMDQGADVQVAIGVFWFRTRTADTLVRTKSNGWMERNVPH